MGRAASAALATRWQERIRRWRRSGLSIAEFCRRERISQPSFFAWRKRLAGSHTPPADRAGRSGLAGEAGQKKASSRLLQLPPPAWSTSGGVQITLPSGAVIALPAHASTELVTAAIRASLSSGAAEDRPC